MMWLLDTIRRKQDQNFCFSDGMSLEILGKTTKNVPFLVQFTLFLSFFRPNDHPICCSDCVTRMRPAKISRRSMEQPAGSEWGSFEVSYSCFIYLAFSWLAKANLAAFSWSLANLFSYLETFLRVGLMNLPFMSLTEMVSSLI